jgi:hypothetical protein
LRNRPATSGGCCGPLRVAQTLRGRPGKARGPSGRPGTRPWFGRYRDAVSTALGRLLSSLPAACDTLTELRGPTHQEGTRLWAAVALLAMATRYHNDVDVCGRLAEVERQVNGEQRIGA